MFKSLPGFREFYPEDCALRNHLFKQWRSAALSFSFAEYDAPLLEPLELFTEKSGDEIVEQLFNFEDKGGRHVSLRPEMTPSLARLIGARAGSLKRPIKWFSIGEQFRYERQQKGRLRSFYQFNADIFGEEGPAADAEIIALAVLSAEGFGLSPNDIKVRLSDRDLWVLVLRLAGVVEDEVPAVLNIADKLERMPEEKLNTALTEALTQSEVQAAHLLEQIQTFAALNSLEGIQAYFAGCSTNDAAIKVELDERLIAWEQLLKRLDALGVSEYVTVDPGIVRGLAYYTGFVFEVFQADGSGRAIAGGGRYDHLVKKLGGPDMPAVGFAMGDVTLRLLLEEKNCLPPIIQAPDVYMIAAGEVPSAAALADATALRRRGIAVDYLFREAGFSKQLKQASQSGARLALLYGETELNAGQVKVRDLRSRVEKDFPRAALSQGLLAEILAHGGLEESGCDGQGGCGSKECNEKGHAS